MLSSIRNAAIAGLGLLAVVLGIRKSGARAERERQEARRTAEHAEALGARQEVINKTQGVRDETDRMSDRDVADRLRDRWTRSDD